MNKIWLIIFAFPALATCSLTASAKSLCDGVSALEDKKDALEDWGALAGGARMSIKVSSDNVSNVIAVVRIKNFSDNTVRLIETVPERDYVFDIKRPDGTAIAETSYGQSIKNSEGEVLRRMVKSLEPEQEVCDEICLSKNFCFEQKGVYKITASRNVFIKAGSCTNVISNCAYLSVGKCATTIP